MTWLAWRLHGGEARLVGLLTALLAAAVVAGRVLLSAADLPTRELGRMSVETVVLGAIAAPALLGMFLGAPVVAAEVERRTHHLAWTQGVSRLRWLLLHVGLALAVGLAAMAVTGAMTYWGLQPLFARAPATPGADAPFQPGTFDAIAIVPAAYAAFAVALGVTLSTFTRRTLVAMFLALVLFVGVRGTIAAARPHFEPPLRVLAPLSTGLESPELAGAYLVRTYTVDAAGREVGFVDCATPAGCDRYRDAIEYQPADRFWTFQLIETGIYAALAALLIALSCWRIARRPA